MESLLVTPLKPLELMIGKITPYIIISFIILALIILLARFIFPGTHPGKPPNPFQFLRLIYSCYPRDRTFHLQ